MKNGLIVASAKGYLLNKSLTLFDKIGIHFEDTESRKLYAHDTTNTHKLLKIRPWDVPEYVEHGAADIGIVGKDVLEEKGNNVIRLADLKFGFCKLVIAGPEDINPKQLNEYTTVATKYPNAAASYFSKLGIKVKLIKLYGAVELAPLTGLADVICDLTETGTTLKEHNLHIIDTVFSTTAYLIANPSSYRSKYDEIMTVTNAIKTHL